MYSHVFAAISPQNDKPFQVIERGLIEYLICYIVTSGASLKLFFMFCLCFLAPSINSLISASASLRSTQYTGNTYASTHRATSLSRQTDPTTCKAPVPTSLH
ncbi:hypothetical protein ALC53_11726 [Atta colombica]|uniref:Uncharacterized protein n=1 Tax=Atta colombica TaxID=520822 RepID=A0A195AZT4_9HYME|nr:hypothetical protein ALC53_11726 [Atta colombica]